MNNIHLIPTDKPSRLSILNSGKLNFGTEIMSSSNSKPQHICITSDKEIKEGDWVISDQMFLSPLYDAIGKIEIISGEIKKIIQSDGSWYWTELETKKIILTTDPDLIKDGVQAIDDEFLEWFVKNPSCEEISIEWLGTYTYGIVGYKIIIPKEEPTAYHYLSCCRSIEECHCGKYPKQIKCYCGHTTTCDCSPIDEPKQEEIDFYAKELMLEKERAYKQEALEEAAEKQWGNVHRTGVLGFIEGAKWEQERSYSEEDMFEFSQWISHEDWVYLPSKGYWVNEEQEELEQKLNSKEILNMWFEQFKKK